MRKNVFFPYSVHTAWRQFGPGFGYDVYGVFDVEGFPKFFHSAFGFFIGLLKKFSKCLSEIISIKYSSNSLTHWLEKWRHVVGKKTACLCFDNVSITGRCLGALPNTSKIFKSIYSALQYACS
jgi:hypothetical protein